MIETLSYKYRHEGSVPLGSVHLSSVAEVTPVPSLDYRIDHLWVRVGPPDRAPLSVKLVWKNQVWGHWTLPKGRASMQFWNRDIVFPAGFVAVPFIYIRSEGTVTSSTNWVSIKLVLSAVAPVELSLTGWEDDPFDLSRAGEVRGG